MATIYRALVTASLLLWGYVAYQMLAAGDAAAAAEGLRPGLEEHLRLGLVAALFAALVQSLPFAYFLGTGFWVKAFLRASNAGAEWELRQKTWMKARAYPLLYLTPLVTLGAAIAGGLAETGRAPAGLHVFLIGFGLALQLLSLLLVPPLMLKNAALMDELAASHRLPKPDTPELDEYIEREEANALPPLFQLSRVLMFFGFQPFVIWAYLRFGTGGDTTAPYLPFAILGCALFALGYGMNARHDPDKPAPMPNAVRRGLVAAALTLLVAVVLPYTVPELVSQLFANPG